ncbi:Nitric oxide reductase activation protein [Lentibacillus halodurans]|uniref:Nitric oxide reductase activation protein n=1 Tax=Lentibacillus halodurans TaxID=237679 RepID=A0A1I0YDA2_9BACI|nr:VWA domain-containing protein [Lentibacillus halodurans]SFB11314.1 Nitric oxide reductase activation protein [Lentibacillus halodurans]
MFRFRETNIDTRLFLQLQDFAAVLSGISDLKFEYAYGSVIDIKNNRITASANWGIGNTRARDAGFKTDILLRTIGTLHHSNVHTMQAFMEHISKSALPKFAGQLFTLFENIRLEEIVKRERPGTANLFAIRRDYLRQYFTQQLEANVTRSLSLDELYCLIYLLIQADSPDPSFSTANNRQTDQLNGLKPVLFELFEADSTVDVTKILERIVLRLENHYSDMTHDYVIFPISDLANYTEQSVFDEITRTDPLANDSLEEDVSKENSDTFEQNFPTWHGENENAGRKQNFLQFELEQGTRSSLMGEGTRETEEGDQALVSIQGASGKSEQNNYSDMEAMNKQQDSQNKESAGGAYGRENQYAVKVIKNAETPTDSDKAQYLQYTEEIAPLQRRLSKTIDKMLEHKRQTPRRNLTAGRLSKKLISAVTEEYPRIFYKKNEASNEMDAAFTLLVDCSASMLNKMEETKKGIVLFHEVLKNLNIPHSIIGFWEDATAVKDQYKPNYFHVIHSFSDSLYQHHGAKIMQLEAQEDNRDGFSIRVATEELVARSEKNRFLLVFSDGEPAASNYHENGIIDTNLAVSEARKKGIDVIGMFLAEDEISEQEDNLMHNIYGRERIMIPSVGQLPEHFAPLLKRLLLKAM